MKNKGYIYELPIKVRDYEVDSQGIVNNANYLHYLEITRHDFCEYAGCSFRTMQRSLGIDPVVRKIEIQYLSPLSLGDEMISRLRMERDGARFIFVQDIYRADTEEPVVRATVTVVCLENGRLSRGDRLAEAFKDYL